MVCIEVLLHAGQLLWGAVVHSHLAVVGGVSLSGRMFLCCRIVVLWNFLDVRMNCCSEQPELAQHAVCVLPQTAAAFSKTAALAKPVVQHSAGGCDASTV